MVISRDKIRVTPFRALITLLITYLLSPLLLQVAFGVPLEGHIRMSLSRVRYGFLLMLF